MVTNRCQVTDRRYCYICHASAGCERPVTDYTQTITEGDGVQTTAFIECIVTDSDQIVSDIQCTDITCSGENAPGSRCSSDIVIAIVTGNAPLVSQGCSIIFGIQVLISNVFYSTIFDPLMVRLCGACIPGILCHCTAGSLRDRCFCLGTCHCASGISIEKFIQIQTLPVIVGCIAGNNLTGIIGLGLLGKYRVAIAILYNVSIRVFFIFRRRGYCSGICRQGFVIKRFTALAGRHITIAGTQVTGRLYICTDGIGNRQSVIRQVVLLIIAQ